MNAFLLSVTLLGDVSPFVRDRMNELDRQRTEQAIERQRAANQQQIAYTDQKEDRTNAYIIGGAIVVGLFLFGLMARGGKK